jgi:hypothetical protein
MFSLFPNKRQYNKEIQESAKIQPKRTLPWDEFPVGIDDKGNLITWNPTQKGSLCLTGDKHHETQELLVSHCIQHADTWEVFGVDIQQVHIHHFKHSHPEIVQVAARLDDVQALCQKVWQEMVNRQEKEMPGYAHSTASPTNPRCQLLIISEFGFLQNSGIKSDEGRLRDEQCKEIRNRLQDIASMGAKVGIYLVISTSSPRTDAEKIESGDFLSPYD